MSEDREPTAEDYKWAIEPTIPQMNEEVARRLGIPFYTWATKGVDGEIYNHSNPDFSTDAGAVQLLREMMNQKDWSEFYLSIWEGTENFLRDYITTPGALLDAYLEWERGKG